MNPNNPRSWQLLQHLRPRTRDLAALAWLASRYAGKSPDGRPVGRYRSVCVFPVYLLMLLGLHASGALAARGRHALLGLSPSWPPARRAYRRRKLLTRPPRSSASLWCCCRPGGCCQRCWKTSWRLGQPSG